MQREGNSGSLRLPRYVEVMLGLAVVVELLTGFTATIDGADSTFHLVWIREFIGLINQGVWFPKWLPNGFHGVGSPTFYFYPPLAYYAAWVVSLVGPSDPTTLFHLVSVIATLASVWTCFALLRAFTPDSRRALVGAVIYGFAPFRVAELYSRSSLSSHVAYVFLPLVALGIYRAFTSTRFDLKNVVLLAFSSAGLVLSSIPATGCALCFGLAAVFVVPRKAILRGLPQLALAAMLTVGLTAFYVIPAYSHSGDAQTTQFFRDPSFFLSELLRLHFTVELAHTVVIAVVTVVTLYAISFDKSAESKNTRRLVWSAVCAVVILQIPVLSLPLWRHVPVLQFIQVPWRLYIGVVLAIAVATTVVRSKREIRLVSLAIGLLALAAICSSILPMLNLHIFPHWSSRDADPPEYLPTRASLTVVHQPDLSDAERAHVLVDSAGKLESVSRIYTTATVQRYHAELASNRVIHLTQLYWPDWRIYKDGTEQRGFQDQHGYSAAILPPGAYDFSFVLTVPPSERAARIASLTTLILMLVALTWVTVNTRRKHEEERNYSGRALQEFALESETTAAL